MNAKGASAKLKITIHLEFGRSKTEVLRTCLRKHSRNYLKLLFYYTLQKINSALITILIISLHVQP